MLRRASTVCLSAGLGISQRLTVSTTVLASLGGNGGQGRDDDCEQVSSAFRTAVNAEASLNHLSSRAVNDGSLNEAWGLPMEDAGYIDPQALDLLLTDVREDDLQFIARNFGTSYLADASSSPTYPVIGQLFGKNYRAVVNMVVSMGKCAKQVIFIVDTGAPYTYLSAATLHALGCRDILPGTMKANVHGRSLNVQPSPSTSHFADVNVLGTDFMWGTEARLLVDYGKMTVRIDNG